MIKDAVACHFDEAEAPKIIRLHYDREEVIQTDADRAYAQGTAQLRGSASH